MLLGQHIKFLLIISLSSKCHVKYMRAGGSLLLFIKSKVHNKEQNKQIEMILNNALISLSMVQGTSILFLYIQNTS